jgi:hypothetical protein
MKLSSQELTALGQWIQRALSNFNDFCQSLTVKFEYQPMSCLSSVAKQKTECEGMEVEMMIFKAWRTGSHAYMVGPQIR